MWELHDKCKALRERIRKDEDAQRKAKGKDPLSEYQLDMLVFNLLSRKDWRKPEFLLAAMGHQWGDKLQVVSYINSKRFVNHWAVNMAKEFCKSPLINMLGCASCVSGDTRILNPITGEQPTIAELYERKENPIVMTLQGPKIASVPFIKGNEPLYEITTETGSKFRCSAAHRLLTPGGYRSMLALSVGDEILCVQDLQASTLEPALSVRVQDALSFRKTTEGSQGDYPACLHSCDEQPPLGAGTGQSFSPSPSDAQERSRCISSHSDVTAGVSPCIHPSLSSNRACMHRTFRQHTQSETRGLFRSSSGMRECGESRRPQSPSQSHSDTRPHSPCESRFPCETHTGSPCSSVSSVEILRSYGLSVSHTKVTSIRNTHSEVFYDIQVPDAHHYFAEGAIHHNSGKTFFSTAYCYTLWKARPWNTSVYLSTTTGEGADARAWANIQSLYRDDKIAYGKLLNSVRTLVMEEVDENDAVHRDLRNAIKCVLIKKGNEGRDVVGAICGRKNNTVCWQCDEMPHMDGGVLSGRVNLFSNPFAQFIGIGNGPMPGDPMFIDAEPDEPGGWKWVNRDEHWKWKTRAGVCLYFNGAKSPNMQVEPGEKPPFPRIMDWQARSEILKACWNDENTPEFFVQFYGFPPSVEVPDTVLTTQFMEAHHAFEQPEWTGDPRKTLAGLDLGFRKDGDPCVLHFGKVGKSMTGKTILAAEPDGIALNPSQKTTEPFEEQISKRVIQECRERDCHDLALDVTGDGGILLQAIEREARAQSYDLKCLAVSFSGIAEDRVTIPGEKRKAREMFDRMVSQLWSTVRVCVGNDVVRGLDERGLATKQLCGRKFSTDENKRFSVESKKDMKKRIKRSPDQGDAFALLMHLALKHGVSGKDIQQPPKPKTWEDLLKKKDAQTRAYTGHSDARNYVSHYAN